MSPMTEHGPLYLIFVTLFLAALLYSPGLSGPFIFDDAAAITANEQIKIDGRQFDEWRTAAVSSNSGLLRRPISMVSFAANHALEGELSSTGIKLGNLLIHLCCGWLVYQLVASLFLGRLRGGDRPSLYLVPWLAATLWVLHPLQVSTVLYAVQRMAQISTLFTLGGLLVFVRYRDRWAKFGADVGELIAAALWVGLLTIAAILSKENGLLLLWLIPVLEVSIYRGKWANTHNAGIAWLGWIALLAPLLFLSFVLEVFPERLIGGYATRDFTLEERVLTQLRLLWTYLGWIIYPDINAMGFQHDDIQWSHSLTDPLTTLFSAIAWVALLLISLVLRNKHPYLLLATLFFLVAHSMESGVIPLEMVYEHRNYLPSVGVCIFVAYIAMAALGRQDHIRVRVPLFATIAVLSVLAFLRVSVWSDKEILTAVNVANHPQSARSHFFLATNNLDEFKGAVAMEASRQESNTYLKNARIHFELAYLSDPENFAALVMLYWMDSHYFSDMGLHAEWLLKLEDLARHVPPRPSVTMSLEPLVDCFSDKLCEEDSSRLYGILDAFSERFPFSPEYTLLEYRYLKKTGASIEQCLEVLQEAASISPGVTRIYRLQLMDYHETGDMSGVYESIRRWMKSDPHRRELSDVRSVFATPQPGAGGLF